MPPAPRPESPRLVCPDSSTPIQSGGEWASSSDAATGSDSDLSPLRSDPESDTKPATDLLLPPTDTDSDVSMSSDSGAGSVITTESEGDSQSDWSEDDSADEFGLTEADKAQSNEDPEMLALRQVRYYQSTTDPLIPVRPFRRLIRQLALQYKTNIQIEHVAADMLQAATEDYLIRLFEHTNVIAISEGGDQEIVSLSCGGQREFRTSLVADDDARCSARRPSTCACTSTLTLASDSLLRISG